MNISFLEEKIRLRSNLGLNLVLDRFHPSVFFITLSLFRGLRFGVLVLGGCFETRLPACVRTRTQRALRSPKLVFHAPLFAFAFVFIFVFLFVLVSAFVFAFIFVLVFVFVFVFVLAFAFVSVLV